MTFSDERLYRRNVALTLRREVAPPERQPAATRRFRSAMEIHGLTRSVASRRTGFTHHATPDDKRRAQLQRQTARTELAEAALSRSPMNGAKDKIMGERSRTRRKRSGLKRLRRERTMNGPRLPPRKTTG
jgi:hypothetical protein